MLDSMEFYKQTHRFLDYELNTRIKEAQFKFIEALHRVLDPADLEYLQKNETIELKNLLSSHHPVILEPHTRPSGSDSNARKNKCLARTSTGKQCIRIRSVKADFCSTHFDVRPFGRIDDPSGQHIYNIDPLLLAEHYIKTRTIYIDKKPYLIDDDTGIIYRCGAQRCTIIAQRSGDLIKWF